MSSYFRLFQSLYQSFWDWIKFTNHNWYLCHLHVPKFFFQFSCKALVLIFLFAFFYFPSVVRRDSQVHYLVCSLFSLTITWSGRLLFFSWEFFHTNASWWCFVGFWVTASFLKSPGLFSEFWPISIWILLLFYCFFFKFIIFLKFHASFSRQP